MRPPFVVFPELFTENLVLRAVLPVDVPLIREIMFYDGKPAQSDEEAAQMLARIEEDYRQGDTVNWAIADAATNQLLGTCGYYRGFAHHTGEIGYVMREQARGRGLMTEAIKAITPFGFAQLGLQKVVAYTKPDNPASVKVLLNAGYLEVPSDEEKYLKFVRESNEKQTIE